MSILAIVFWIAFGIIAIAAGIIVALCWVLGIMLDAVEEYRPDEWH